MSNTALALSFFLQLAIILVVCRIVGFLGQKVGQPLVVGEMIAGIILGPSCFGLLFPTLQAQIFPHATTGILYTISQVGLTLYMFLIGAEFDLSLLQPHMRKATTISLAGIFVPLLLGALIAFFLLPRLPGILFAPSLAPGVAMLFLGTCISITAFPVLARIIYDRNLTGTFIGTLTLAASSLDDAIAWCILALLLALSHRNGLIALETLGGGIIYVAVTLIVIRKAFQPLGGRIEKSGTLSNTAFTMLLILLMLCAWANDAIGMDAIFGAFVLGIAMPRGKFVTLLREKIGPLCTNLFVPLFFVYSGLNTRIDLINTPLLWAVTLLLLFAAILGKVGACWLTARLSRIPHRQAAAIGSLMNARGLIELVFLNIGLQQGLLTKTLFSMLVIMAIVTTLMASPLFDWFYGRWQEGTKGTVTEGG